MSSLFTTSRGAAAGRMLRFASSGPRTRSLPNSVPTLQEFVHKQKVLRQYRSFLKAIRLIQDETDRENAFLEVKRDFKAHAALQNTLATQMAVTDGLRKLKQVQSMVGYSDENTEDDQDSWLNTPDTEDPRGRVGTEWPWQR